jgi:DNA modification methylase
MKPPVRQRRRRGADPYVKSIANDNAGQSNWLTAAPDIRIEYRTLAEIKSARRQLRKHDRKQIDQIAALIQRVGFINPIIVDACYTIVSGEGRYRAAGNLKLLRIPVIRVEHLSEAELRAFALADNKLVLNDSWNEELLAVELSELMAIDIDLPIELTAFNTAEIDNIILKSSTPTPDGEGEIPEPPAKPVSRIGDLFTLGELHRLYCADARDDASYTTLMEGALARVIFSDNPYNQKPSNINGLGKIKHASFVMASGEMSKTEFTQFLATIWKHLADHSIDGSIHYQCMDHRHLPEVVEAGELAYDEFKTLIIWDKQVAGMGSFYRNQHELIFVFKKGTAPHTNTFGLGQNGRNRSTIWSYPGANMMRKGRLETLALHPTVKNLTMVVDAIRDVSARGEIVLDPFCGAGTTILAAERTGRRARCLELDPKYVDVAIQRWEAMTGQQAVHVETGLSFAELRLERFDDAEGEEA